MWTTENGLASSPENAKTGTLDRRLVLSLLGFIAREMKPGDRISSRNSQLDAYLARESDILDEKSHVGKKAGKSWDIITLANTIALGRIVGEILLTSVLLIASLSWKLCNRNVTFRMQSLGFRPLPDTYDTPHALAATAVIVIIYPIIAIHYRSFWLFCILLIILCTPVCLAYAASSFLHSILDQYLTLEQCISNSCGIIRKVQISISGRELLCPLPPVNKLEELVMSTYGVEDRLVALRPLRCALAAVITTLQNLFTKEITALNIDSTYPNTIQKTLDMNRMSDEQRFSTRTIQRSADIAFKEVLPTLLEATVNIWNNLNGLEHSNTPKVTVFRHTQRKYGLLYTVYVLVRSVQCLYVVSWAMHRCLRNLDEVTRCPAWSLVDTAATTAAATTTTTTTSVQGASTDNSTDTTATGEGQFKSCDDLQQVLSECRGSLAQMKCSYEDALLRVYLCEERLSSITVPLLAYSQRTVSAIGSDVHPLRGSFDEATPTVTVDRCHVKSSLTRRDVLHVAQVAEEALLLLCGVGLGGEKVQRAVERSIPVGLVHSPHNPIGDVDVIMESAREWNVPTSQTINDTVMAVAELVRCLERHGMSFISSHAQEVVQRVELLERSGPRNDAMISTVRAETTCDELPPPIELQQEDKTCESTSFGDDDWDDAGCLAVAANAIEAKQSARAVDVITASVMSDSEINALNDEALRESKRREVINQKYAQMSKKLMVELQEQMQATVDDRREVERPLDGACGESNQSKNIPNDSKQSDESMDTAVVEPVSAEIPSIASVVSASASFGLRGELKDVLKHSLLSEKNSIHYLGDSCSSDDEDGLR